MFPPQAARALLNSRVSHDQDRIIMLLTKHAVFGVLQKLILQEPDWFWGSMGLRACVFNGLFGLVAVGLT